MTYTPTPQRSWIANSGANLSSGFSLTIPDGITLAILKAAALLATGTITLPANPLDGQPLTINTPKGITLLTLNANAGQSLSNGLVIASMGINAASRLKYSQADATWYPN